MSLRGLLRPLLVLALGLVASPTTAAESAAELLVRAAFLERAGEPDAALRVAQRAVRAGGGHDAAVHAGWLSYRVGDTEGALAFYEQARQVRPDSASAGLGVTLVLATLERWDDLATVAESLVAQHPKQLWGWVRLGLAQLQRGYLDEADTAYGRALHVQPEHAEALLGLGFVARARGDEQTAREHCERAASALSPGDRRVVACLAPLPERGPSLTITPSVWGMFAGYTNVYVRDTVWSVAAETELQWASGPGMRLGLAYSQTELPLTDETFQQVMPGAGVWYVAPTWRIELGYQLLWKEPTDERTEHAAELSAGGLLGAGFGLGASVGTVAASDRAVLQATPALTWSDAGGIVTLALRATVSWWANGDDDLQGTLHASGELGLTVVPLSWLAIDAAGWYGRRRSYLESGARWVWNTDDVLTGGWRLGLRFHVARPAWLFLRARHDVGIEQAGLEMDFHLITGQAGVLMSF